MLWSSAVVTKKFSEAAILSEQAKALQLRTETLKELLEAQKRDNDMVLEAEVRHLYNQNYKSDTNNVDTEQIARLRLSVITLAELIQKGTEVHPALNSPENVSNLFPKFSELPLIESKIKKIENQ